MLKRFCLAAVMCLIAFSAYAEEKKFDNFSVDMPSGWQLMGEPVKQMGAEVVMMANPAEGAVVIVTFAPTQGEDLKAVVEQTKQAMKAQGMDLNVAEENDTKIVFEGKQAGQEVKLLLTVDPDAKQIGTMVYSGKVAAGEVVGKTVKTTNSKLAFY